MVCVLLRVRDPSPNDEDHVVPGSAQPLRVPVAGSLTEQGQTPIAVTSAKPIPRVGWAPGSVLCPV